MKIIAAVTADFDRTFLGLPSRLNTDLRGETVIRRTLKLVRAAREPASVHLLVTVAQEAAAKAATAGLDVTVETHDAAPPPWSRYVASARKWSLDSWRGGLAGTTVYDEAVHPWLLESLARREGADAVIDIPAAAPLLDPDLLDQLVRHYVTIHQDSHLAVVQTAPGLSAIVYQTEFLTHLTQAAQPPGRVMSYRPDEPQRELLLQPCLLACDASIAHGFGRCIADTSTAMKRLERLLADVSPTEPDGIPDAMSVSRWLRQNRHTVDTLPREIEVEITTQDPLPTSRVRPRGAALGRSGEMSFDTFRRIVDGLAGCDDRLLVLGGFGDPLLHPEWARFARHAHDAGILGIAIRTTGVNLDKTAIEAMIDAQVDVLNVLLDAATPETYRRLHVADCYDRVIANIDSLCAHQHQRQCPIPLIVCEMAKTRETFDEMEAFYDHWLRKTASAVIVGPSQYAGQWPDLSVMNMAPPARRPCSRIFSRATILADGRMVLCDQDFRGSQAVGSTTTQDIQDLWRGTILAATRDRHLHGGYDGLPLCPQCSEWHRP